ncbi:MAG: cell wall hydrolase, partial [Bacillota bacterium]
MDKIHIKKVIVILTMILLLNTVFIPFLMPAAEVKASSIEKEDIYTGLGLMFLMVVLGSGNDKNQEAASDDFYNYKNFNAEEMEILASIINAEARGESYEGKVAVGAV